MNDRYVFCIRDPRDVIVSAAYYHCRSDEDWLHEPKVEFNGMTYQEKIVSLPTMQDRFKFEMAHTSLQQIRNMLKVPHNRKDIYVTKFETLVNDSKLIEFGKIFRFLEFESEIRNALLKIAAEKSLFSGNLKKSIHIRSGTTNQWINEFSQDTLHSFKNIFGNAVVELGYTYKIK